MPKEYSTASIPEKQSLLIQRITLSLPLIAGILSVIVPYVVKSYTQLQRDQHLEYLVLQPSGELTVSKPDQISLRDSILAYEMHDTLNEP